LNRLEIDGFLKQLSKLATKQWAVGQSFFVNGEWYTLFHVPVMLFERDPWLGSLYIGNTYNTEELCL